jgi:hypothetical protein
MPAISGAGTSFKLHNSSAVLTDISTLLDGVDGSSDADELDGTTFQPGVAAPIKNIIPGFRTRGYTLSGKWSSTAEDFFAAIEGFQNLSYEYGPEGTATGKKKISGTCNCLSYTGPQSSVDGITTFQVELRVNTRVVATY